MSKSIKIDDETYMLVAEFAKREDRPLSNALSRLVKLGLSYQAGKGAQASVESSAPASVPLKERVATANGDEEKNRPVKNTSDNKKIDWGEIMKQVQEEVGSGEWDRKYKEALERDKSRKSSLGDLTEEDLATAKVTFEERPDFEEPEEWNGHAWPTV